MVKTVNKETVSISASHDQAHTISLVHKVDDVLSPLMSDLIEKAGVVALGPITVLNMLRTVINGKDKDGNDLADNISVEFPRLGTTSIEGEDGYVKGNNEYCERYEAPMPGKDGNTKVKKLNFFTEFANATAKGTALQFVKAQCELASSKDSANAEPKYKAMDNIERETLLDETKKQISFLRGMIRQGIGVWFTVRDLMVVTDSKDRQRAILEPTSSASYPYDLVNGYNARQGQALAVADILKLDIRKALAEAGETGSLYDTLLAQLARDTNKAKNKKYPMCENPEQIYDAACAIVNGLDEYDELSTAVKVAMGKKSGGADYVKVLGLLRNAINALWSKSLQVSFDRSLDKDIEQAADETEAESAAA